MPSFATRYPHLLSLLIGVLLVAAAPAHAYDIPVFTNGIDQDDSGAAATGYLLTDRFVYTGPTGTTTKILVLPASGSQADTSNDCIYATAFLSGSDGVNGITQYIGSGAPTPYCLLEWANTGGSESYLVNGMTYDWSAAFSGASAAFVGQSVGNDTAGSQTTAYTGFSYGSVGVSEVYFVLYQYSATPPVGSTYIASVEPLDTSTQATSTTFTFGASGGVSTDDFIDGMYLQIKYSNNAGIPSNSVVGPLYSGGGQAICNWLPDWLCPPIESDSLPTQTSISGTTFKLPITTSGEFDISTTTDIQQIGRYTMETSIVQPGFNVFGFVLSNSTLVSTTTTFLVATSTAWDVSSDIVDEQVAALNEAATESGCSINFASLFTQSNIASCIQFLFTAPALSVANALQNQIADIASRAPWGYATRVYVIMSGDTATTSLPSIAAEVPEGLPMAGTAFDFTPWEPTEAAIDLFENTPGQPGSNVLADFEHWWNIMWLIVFAIWVMREMYETFGGLELEHNPESDFRGYSQGKMKTYRVMGKSPVRFRRTKP